MSVNIDDGLLRADTPSEMHQTERRILLSPDCGISSLCRLGGLTGQQDPPAAFSLGSTADNRRMFKTEHCTSEDNGSRANEPLGFESVSHVARLNDASQKV
jgi:hypothetical protein